MEQLGGRYGEAWEGMWNELIRTERRVGPDTVPRTKTEWQRHFQGLVAL
eukprot:gene33166-2020_t